MEGAPGLSLHVTVPFGNSLEERCYELAVVSISVVGQVQTGDDYANVKSHGLVTAPWWLRCRAGWVARTGPAVLLLIIFFYTYLRAFFRLLKLSP